MPATNRIRLFERLMARLPESSLLGLCPATDRGLARGARARADAHTCSTASLRIQARGGGEGGLDDRVVAAPVRADACGAADGLNTTLVGARGSAETPAHFSAQSADFRQSPLVC